MSGDSASAAPELVGREREQRQLQLLLHRALEGHGRLALVSGEAGLGKTTLVEALGRQAREHGALALTGYCHDLARTPPYGPWFEMLATYRALDTLPEPPPTLLPDPQDPSVPSQAALLEHLRAFFATVSRERPLLLVIEDLHWADPATLDALAYLGQQVSALPMLIVATYRDDELPQRHPLFPLLPRLLREARAERVELSRLGKSAVRRWVASDYALAPPDSARLVDYLHATAEGNPLYISETLRVLERDGILRPTLVGWALGDLHTIGVPLLLRQLIAARLQQVRAETHELLTIAAVIGHDVPLPVWSAVANVSRAQLLDAIDDAVRANLLRAGRDGLQVAFTHALIRAALYEEILPPRRRAWHDQVGEFLLTLPNPDPDSVAYHFEQAGDPRAAEWLIRAADRAFAAWALQTAAVRYEAALSLLAPHVLPPGERAWLLLRLAEAYRYTDARRALDYLATADALAAAVADPALAALTTWRFGQIRGLVGEHGLAELEAGYAALMELPATERERLWITQRLDEGAIIGATCRWLALYGRYAQAAALGEAYLADTPYEVRTAGADDACLGLGMADIALGRPERARRALLDAFSHYDQRGMQQLAQVAAFVNLAALELVYYPDQLAQRAEQTRAVAEVWTRASSIRGDIDPQAVFAPLALIEGRWDEAERYARQLVRPAFHISALGWLGWLARARGIPERAWEHVVEALPDGPGADPETTAKPAFLATLALVALAAELALDAGDQTLADAWIATHGRWLTWSGALLGQAEHDLLLARYDEAFSELGQAAAHAAHALAHARSPRQPLAELAALRALGRLERRRQRYVDAAAHLDAALALADACAAPFERALTLLERAALLAALGNVDAARQTLHAVRAICEPLGATPALERAARLEENMARSTHTAEPIAGLTARELDVLRLASTGLTDAQVAEQLFISPRTVSQHLRSIYNKLGVSSRTAAAAFATEHGII